MPGFSLSIFLPIANQMNCIQKRTSVSIFRNLLCGWLSIALCAVGMAAETPPSFLWSSFLDCQGGGMLAYGLHVDDQGNATFTGKYSQGFNIGGTVVPSGWGIFVIRIDRFGNLVWATHDGGTSTTGTTMTCDPSGNSYVLCTLFQESTEPMTLCGMSVTGRVALAKYDNNGQGLWAVSLASKGSGSSLDPLEITGDLNGNLYWTARLNGSAKIAQTNISASGTAGFLVKNDSSGIVRWVRAAIAPSQTYSPMTQPAADRHGNVYVTGTIAPSLSFGVTNLVSNGSADIFVAKYNSDGNLLWIRQAGGPGSDTTFNLTLDPEGNCLVTCGFQQSATFGDITITNSSPGQYVAIAKYDPSGNVLWATQIYQDYNLTILSTDAEGNCYVAADPLNATSLLFQKLDPDGNLIWSRTAPKGRVMTWAVDRLGHGYLLGSFTPDQTISRPTLLFDNVSVTSLGHLNDFFLLKLDTTTAPRLAAQHTASDLELSWPVVADGYHLESSSSLVDPTAWTSNSVLPTVADGNKKVTVGAAASGQFFRLKKD